MSHDEDIKKYEQEAERLKTAYLQCLGIVQYLKQKKESSEKDSQKEEKKE